MRKKKLHPFRASTYRVKPDPSAPSSHLRNARPTSYVNFGLCFRSELAKESFYKVSIDGTRLSLSELQESDRMAQKIRAKGLQEDREEIDRVLHPGPPLCRKLFRTKLIIRHHDKPLAVLVGFDKTRELTTRK